MKRLLVLAGILVGIMAFTVAAQEKFERDIVTTPAGNLEIAMAR